jgi:hypothetical protein
MLIRILKPLTQEAKATNQTHSVLPIEINALPGSNWQAECKTRLGKTATIEFVENSGRRLARLTHERGKMQDAYDAFKSAVDLCNESLQARTKQVDVERRAAQEAVQLLQRATQAEAAKLRI